MQLNKYLKEFSETETRPEKGDDKERINSIIAKWKKGNVTLGECIDEIAFVLGGSVSERGRKEVNEKAIEAFKIISKHIHI